MFALKVQINDQTPVIGGADDLGVLSAIVTCVGKLGALSSPTRDDESQDFTFRLGGLTSRPKGSVDEHLIWLQNDALQVGDKITIEITEVEKTDPVIGGQETEQA